MDNYLQTTFWAKLINNGLNWMTTEMPGIIVVLVIAILAFATVRVLFKRLRAILVKRAEKHFHTDPNESIKRIDTLIGIIHSLIKVVLWTIFIMMILQKLSINIAPILASAGIIGLAVGFGAQELVRDYISGFFIILENQIRTNDVAIINGTGGLVEKIELRTTTLRDLAGVVHIFQNGKISSISNMTKDWSAIVLDIGVAYKEDPQSVMAVMKQVGDDMQKDPDFQDMIIEPIEIFGVDQFGDSAVVIKARIKTKPIQQWNVGREYRKRLKVEFDKNNIEIPFPHTTVYWGDKINPLKLDINKGAEVN